MIQKIAILNTYICHGQYGQNKKKLIEFQLIMVLKKPSYPVWTLIFIFMVSLFFVGFYLNGKFSVNYSWSDDWGKVLCIIFVFFYISMNVGYEWSKILSYVRLTKKMDEDKHHYLYEFLHGYIAEYNMSEKPRLDFFKKVFLIRLIHLSCNKTINVATDEVCQLCHSEEKERVIQLNMLIDHWIEEFIKYHNDNIKKLNERKNFKDKIEEINVSDEMQFNVMSFLMTNICHEIIDAELKHNKINEQR